MTNKVTIATIRIASPVPALDRDFEYLVDDAFTDALAVGSLVQVPFGRSNSPKSAFVVSLRLCEPEDCIDLKSLDSLISVFPQFNQEQLTFLKALANRQGSSFSELMAQAAPKRSVRLEKQLANVAANGVSKIQGHQTEAIMSAKGSVIGDQPRSAIPTRVFIRLPATEESQSAVNQSWVRLFLDAAEKHLRVGKSTIILLPDFRELAVLESALAAQGMLEAAARMVSSDALTHGYKMHLLALDQSPRIIYGLRSAALAPAHNLGLICALDESDTAFIEQSSPYWVCRDAVLTRSQSSNVDVLFASRVASAEIERLIEIGFVSRQSMATNAPAVHINSSNERLDQTSFGLIRRALDADKCVLVQVATLGHTNSLFCSRCGQLARCSKCNAALILPFAGRPICRYCPNDAHAQGCPCGNSDWRWGRAGLERVAEELAKSFIDAKVLSASGSDVVTEVGSTRTIVVATAGSEPRVERGYDVVTFIDADAQLAGNRLRNAETAMRHWLNACAKLAPSGKAIFRLADSDFARQIGRFAIDDISAQEWQSRKESGLPPARRLASISSTDQITLAKAFSELSKNFECFRSASDPNKIGVLYHYADADSLKQNINTALFSQPNIKQAKSSTGKIRNIRAVTVKYDDLELI